MLPTAVPVGSATVPFEPDVEILSTVVVIDVRLVESAETCEAIEKSYRHSTSFSFPGHASFYLASEMNNQKPESPKRWLLQIGRKNDKVRGKSALM